MRKLRILGNRTPLVSVLQWFAPPMILLSAAVVCAGSGTPHHLKAHRNVRATPSPTPTGTPVHALEPVALIIGGTGMIKVPTGESPAVLSTAEVYSPKRHVSIPISSMSSGRSHHSAVELPNGDVLVVGGVNALFVPLIPGPTVPWILASADIFSSANGRFAPAGNMTAARDSPSATMLNNGKVLIVGGGTSSAELYDPRTGKFTTTGSMATERYGQTATLLTSGKVLVAGGGSPQAEIYDPNTGKFSPAGVMHQNRIYHTATLLLDGRVLIAGGSPYARSSATSSTELYDPLSNSFESGPTMLESRAGHTATLLMNGQVLVAGGHGDNTAEIYDPVAEQFAWTGNMGVSRFGHSATRFPDGTVLIAGGWNKSYQPLASTELYDPQKGVFVPGTSMSEPRADHTATLIRVRWPISWAKASPTPTPKSSPTPTASPTPTPASTESATATPTSTSSPASSAAPTPNSARSTTPSSTILPRPVSGSHRATSEP